MRRHLYGEKDIVPSFSAMHTVGFYLSDRFQLLDFAGPAAAFENATGKPGSSAYRVVALSARGGTVRNSLGMACDTETLGAVAVDTLLVIGGAPESLPTASALAAITKTAASCQRVGSVCVGAFTLAAARLLDNRRATTHWRYAARLQKEYPQVQVEAERIFCRDGHVWTSAGITAGIDLALALIEQDHGFAVARSVAQELVVYPRRLGGQSQFAASVEAAPTNERIAAALRYARGHISKPFTMEQMAAAAGLSLRQFNRAFRLETGTTPARAVERIRADLARGRIEAGPESIERIAVAVGFGDAERMRRTFLRVFGHPPQSVRRFGRPAKASRPR